MQPEQPTKNEIEAALSALTRIEKLAREKGIAMDELAAPVRQTLLKRFPVLFLLLTTLGATAVFLSLENLLLQVTLFDEKPWLLFLVGVGILTVTGRLYKRLG